MPRVIVYHSYYGCDTGCCGHRVELLQDGQDEGEGDSRFDFTHNYGGDDEDSRKAFAMKMLIDEFGEEHCKDLDWENCRIGDFC